MIFDGGEKNCNEILNAIWMKTSEMNSEYELADRNIDDEK